MARGINKVILVGNVGGDPEVRYTASGTAVANFSLATSSSYKDKEGNVIEKTTWHKLVAWARLAEIVGEYVKKGRQLYIEGEIDNRSYEDADGNTRYVSEVKVSEMQMLGGRTDEDTGEQVEAKTTVKPAKGKTRGKDSDTQPDDDLPF